MAAALVFVISRRATALRWRHAPHLQRRPWQIRRHNWHALNPTPRSVSSRPPNRTRKNSRRQTSGKTNQGHLLRLQHNAIYWLQALWIKGGWRPASKQAKSPFLPQFHPAVKLLQMTPIILAFCISWVARWMPPICCRMRCSFIKNPLKEDFPSRRMSLAPCTSPAGV